MTTHDLALTEMAESLGTIVHNVEMKPGAGGKIARAAGTYAQLVGKDAGYAQDKLQSVRLVEGPLQRRLHLATVHLDTAGRNVHAAFRHRDRREAAELTDTLARIARSARSYNR